jgi:hypothetical protein
MEKPRRPSSHGPGGWTTRKGSADMDDDTQRPPERASNPELPARTSAATYTAWMLHGSDCQPCMDSAPCETGARLHQDYREARITPGSAQ